MPMMDQVEQAIVARLLPSQALEHAGAGADAGGAGAGGAANPGAGVGAREVSEQRGGGGGMGVMRCDVIGVMIIVWWRLLFSALFFVTWGGSRLPGREKLLAARMRIYFTCVPPTTLCTFARICRLFSLPFSTPQPHLHQANNQAPRWTKQSQLFMAHECALFEPPTSPPPRPPILFGAGRKPERGSPGGGATFRVRSGGGGGFCKRRYCRRRGRTRSSSSSGCWRLSQRRRLAWAPAPVFADKRGARGGRPRSPGCRGRRRRRVRRGCGGGTRQRGGDGGEGDGLVGGGGGGGAGGGRDRVGCGRGRGGPGSSDGDGCGRFGVW